MKKTLLALTLAALSSHVMAASLDVYGDIKVKGKVVIDADGNFVGKNSPESIVMADYFNENGLTKTFKTQQKDKGEYGEQNSVDGTMISDHSQENIEILTFNSGDKDSSPWQTTNTYESKDVWHREAQNEGYSYTAGEDGEEATSTGYKIGSVKTERTWLGPQEPKTLAYGATYVKYYEDTTTKEECSEVEGDSCTVGDKSTTTVVETAVLLGKTTYKNGNLSYDDCHIMQFTESNQTSPWTAIHCKGVGEVKGWNATFSKELTSVEGTLIK